MTTVDETDRLILALAADSARPTRVATLRPAIAVAAVAGLLVALVLSLAFLASETRLAAAAQHRWLYQKLFCMAVLAVGAWPIVIDLARPERSQPRYAALVPGALLLLAGAVWDGEGIDLAGRAAYSVPECLAAIVLLSIPGLALILAALRGCAATTRPMMAGSAAGLLAGALAAAAYALACRNDGGLFILVWYGSALAFVGALGAAAGRFALAW